MGISAARPNWGKTGRDQERKLVGMSCCWHPCSSVSLLLRKYQQHTNPRRNKDGHLIKKLQAPWQQLCTLHPHQIRASPPPASCRALGAPHGHQYDPQGCAYTNTEANSKIFRISIARLSHLPVGGHRHAAPSIWKNISDLQRGTRSVPTVIALSHLSPVPA